MFIFFSIYRIQRTVRYIRKWKVQALKVYNQYDRWREDLSLRNLSMLRKAFLIFLLKCEANTT